MYSVFVVSYLRLSLFPQWYTNYNERIARIFLVYFKFRTKFQSFIQNCIQQQEIHNIVWGIIFHSQLFSISFHTLMANIHSPFSSTYSCQTIEFLKRHFIYSLYIKAPFTISLSFLYIFINSQKNMRE